MRAVLTLACITVGGALAINFRGTTTDWVARSAWGSKSLRARQVAHVCARVFGASVCLYAIWATVESFRKSVLG